MALTKLTPIVRATLVEAYADGLTDVHAAGVAGVSYETVRNWLAWGEEGREPYATLYLEVRHTEGELARSYLKRIKKVCGLGGKRLRGDGDWKAAAWFLERRFPKIYGAAAKEAPAPKASEDKPFSPWPRPTQRPDETVGVQ